MDRNTFTGSLDVLAKRVPFRPFTITLVNGQQYEIDYPGAINYRAGTGVYISPGGIPVIFDYEGVAQITGDLMKQQEAA